MYRKDFIKTMALLPLSGIAMKLNQLDKITSLFSETEKMPVLFLGHGSPMNAIEENEFTKEFNKIGNSIPKPKAILCISAHWETNGTFVTAMQKPKTIHDFRGFPKELYEVQYPAQGNPELAKQIKNSITNPIIGLDQDWGLDHGAWSVIKHLYPNADIPVLQMSLDYNKNPQYHYELGNKLAELRKKGLLIIGSGNMVHNLRMVAWDKINNTYGYDWALEAREKMNKYILDGDHQSLINYQSRGKELQLAIPTPDHFLPLLYSLALKEENESISLFNDKPMAGSLTMTSVKISD